MILASALLLSSPGEAQILPDEQSGSISCGTVNRGALSQAAALEVEGPCWVIPEPWRSRNLRFGTRELVSLLRRASCAVRRVYPGARLGVADLSHEHGGPVPNHGSHQSGRDVDLLYFALDGQGRPLPPDGYMPVFRGDGTAEFSRTTSWTPLPAPRRFDAERTWALIQALIGDPHVEVSHIFVSYGIRRRLLAHARDRGVARQVFDRARGLLRRPRGAAYHEDHIHLRIACPAEDVRLGRCRERPSRRRRRYRRVACPHHPLITTAARAPLERGSGRVSVLARDIFSVQLGLHPGGASDGLGGVLPAPEQGAVGSVGTTQ